MGDIESERGNSKYFTMY